MLSFMIAGMQCLSLLLLYFTPFQINTLSSNLRELYDTQGAIHIRDGCLPFPNFCAANPCKNGAPCYNRKDRYHCDCTGMIYADEGNDICSKSKFLKLNLKFKF